MPRAGLTAKQQRFVEEYLVDLNATAAAKRAGYSAKTAEWQGPRLITLSHVAAEVSKAKASVSERTGITVQQVVEDLRRLQSKAEEVGEFAPAVKATELLGKHVGAFEQDNRQKNPLGNFDAAVFFADIFRSPGGV